MKIQSLLLLLLLGLFACSESDDDYDCSSVGADCLRCGGCVAVCGNGVREGSEECDDGNLAFGDGCSVDCRLDDCGNGILESGEECDEGTDNARAADRCRPGCLLPVCGDGILDSGEECDDERSDHTPDACRMDCRKAFCGDGVVDTGEECDEGADNADDLPNRCRSNCRLPKCGDGVLDSFEECDDGNTVTSDGCSASCRQPSCGDGVLDPGELCLLEAEETPFGEGAMFAALLKLDRDQHLDCVATAAGDGVFRMLLGTAGSGFEPGLSMSTGASPGPIVGADVDGDGDADVVLASAAGLEVWLNNGEGYLGTEPVQILPLATTLRSLSSFTHPSSHFPALLGAGADGSARVFVWEGDAYTEAFLVETGGTAVGGAAGDLDGDDYPELVFAAPDRDALVIISTDATGIGAAELVPLAVGTEPVAVAVGDIDGDGDEDIALLEKGNASLGWLVNPGTGEFSRHSRVARVVGSTPVAFVLSDLNRDGALDVAVVDGGSNLVYVLRNDGQGAFTLAATRAVGAGAGWIVAGDTNRDNRPDLVVVNRDAGSISRISSTR